MEHLINLFTSNEYLATMMIVLPVVMLANTIMGMTTGFLKFEFDWKQLGRGLIKSIGFYFSIFLMVVAAMIMPELGVELNGEIFTIIRALEFGILGAVLWYVGDFFKKFIKALPSKVKVDVEPIGVEELDYTREIEHLMGE